MIALDLFAGTGWGVACKRLGIEEHGVEIMPEAIATREANGMHTIYHDVWEGLDNGMPTPDYELLIASPPCQTFSMAGNGAGRAALDEVIGLIRSRLFVHPHELREFGERHDPRTALVLTPLAHVARDTPRLVVFEQVPTVLPVWEACAEVMREWGYSVWTGNLQAEMYGVPQTRKRAVLIARWDAEAKPPTPTHSRYYPRDPAKLDQGVAPWVSMADALWGMTERPSMTVTGGGAATGGAEPFGRGARDGMEREFNADRWLVSNDRQANSARRHASTPAPTITGGHDSGNRVWLEKTSRGIREAHEPASTMTSKAGSMRWGGAKSTRVTSVEAAILQSYPEGFEFKGGVGKVSLQIGNAVPPLLAEAILKTLLD